MSEVEIKDLSSAEEPEDAVKLDSSIIYRSNHRICRTHTQVFLADNGAPMTGTLSGGFLHFANKVYSHGAHLMTIFYKKCISRKSAVSSTNFRSILVFASCVVGT